MAGSESRRLCWAPGVLRMDSPARRDMVTDMAIGLILENGLAAVTVRGVAKKIGIAAPTLLGWYGSAERVRLVVGQTYCVRWVQWIQRRAFRDGPVALLPLTADEVGWARVWQAVLELARLDDDVAACVDGAVAFERHLVRTSGGRRGRRRGDGARGRAPAGCREKAQPHGPRARPGDPRPTARTRRGGSRSELTLVRIEERPLQRYIELTIASNARSGSSRRAITIEPAPLPTG